MGSGFSHVGVSTHDMDGTIHFYEGILGFKRLADERIRITQGGSLRQVSFSVGEGQYLVFMEPRGVVGISDDYDTGINRALGVPGGMYHFAFQVSTLEALKQRRHWLLAQGVDASELIDLGVAMSIFVVDPNGLQLEFCCPTRGFTDADMHKQSTASMALS